MIVAKSIMLIFSLKAYELSKLWRLQEDWASKFYFLINKWGIDFYPNWQFVNFKKIYKNYFLLLTYHEVKVKLKSNA